MLKEKAPKLFEYLQQVLNKLQNKIIKDTLYKQVEQQWTKAGYKIEDWNSMTQEERNYIIKNCL